MKRLTTFVAAGFVSASVVLAAPAMAAGPSAPVHSEVGAVNPAPLPPSVVSKGSQPAAGSKAGNNWWSGELNNAASIVGLVTAAGVPGIAPSLGADINALNAGILGN